MTDIVERLHSMPSSLNDALRVMEEAADEIERLRAANESLAAMAESDRRTNDDHVDEIERLRSDLADSRLMIDEWQAKANRRADDNERLRDSIAKSCENIKEMVSFRRKAAEFLEKIDIKQRSGPQPRFIAVRRPHDDEDIELLYYAVYNINIIVEELALEIERLRANVVNR